jgi:hypothetical protein
MFTTFFVFYYFSKVAGTRSTVRKKNSSSSLTSSDCFLCYLKRKRYNPSSHSGPVYFLRFLFCLREEKRGVPKPLRACAITNVMVLYCVDIRTRYVNFLNWRRFLYFNSNGSFFRGGFLRCGRHVDTRKTPPLFLCYSLHFSFHFSLFICVCARE